MNNGNINKKGSGCKMTSDMNQNQGLSQTSRNLALSEMSSERFCQSLASFSDKAIVSGSIQAIHALALSGIILSGDLSLEWRGFLQRKSWFLEDLGSIKCILSAALIETRHCQKFRKFLKLSFPWFQLNSGELSGIVSWLRVRKMHSLLTFTQLNYRVFLKFYWWFE
jgi:hypothetical protein